MAAAIVPISSAGVNQTKTINSASVKCGSFPTSRHVTFQSKTRSRLCINAQYNDRRSGSGADFVGGFLLGGAVFGTLAYIFAPQIRKSLLNEDEHGFRKARRPIYYDEDEGLEKIRVTLKEKISQLNSAIDNVSSRLRGGNKFPPIPVDDEAEEAAL